MTVQAFDGVHGDMKTQNCGFVNTASSNLLSDFTQISWHQGSMRLSQEILARIMEMEPNMADLARKAGINHDQVARFYKGTKTNYEHVAAMLEAVGARVLWPDERQDLTREVVFANPKMVNVPDGAQPPESHNYLAVPMVGMSGAGRGMNDPVVPDGNYLMVIRNHPSIMRRSNLIGVKIGRGETSMKGLLNPGDIVVVDRNDIRNPPRPPGNIFLVRDPDSEEGAMVKRVVFRESRKGTMDIVFYSENAAEHPPMVYDFQETFEGEVERALIGRVVVCFSDMTDK
jgi:lambda repressor-like predicted transcriptional regulator